jgi:Sec-independent protein translocase protein TatA
VLNLDPAKLLVIAVVAVIVLGPERLPQVGRQLGSAWRSLSEFRHRMESEVRSTMPDLPSSTDLARLARSPSALLEHLSNISTSPEVEPNVTPTQTPAEAGSSDDLEVTVPADQSHGLQSDFVLGDPSQN